MIVNVVKQKRFYPYEYMSGFEKFKEILPSKERFYSSLRGREVNSKDYEHALEVWNAFGMKTMKDYHNI